MRQGRIRVMLVEDDDSMLACLEREVSQAPGLKCVGAYTTFEKARDHINNKLPDIILLDLSLPGMDGVEGTAVIHKIWPRIRVVVFSGASNEERIYSAFQAGATGFLLKNSPRAELIAGIERAYEGGCPISPEVKNALVSFFQRRQTLMPHLSPTEKVILEEFDRGVPQKEIAARLNMSPHTLRTHANRILEKTGVSSLLRAGYLQRQSVK